MGQQYSQAEKSAYEHLINKDSNGNPLNHPLIVQKSANKITALETEFFKANFSQVVSLIAYPGEGKSRCASALYKELRGRQDLDFFKQSNSGISFTKGVWRLSNMYKLLDNDKDVFDVLDVEGLAKENIVYYLLISVTILSKAVVILSRTRINIDALKVIAIAFKMIQSKGFVLSKPALFIQAPHNKEGVLMLNGKGASKNQVREEIIKEVPMISQFKVKFVHIREIPTLESLQTLEEQGIINSSELAYAAAQRWYTEDIKKLVERLKKVRDPTTTERRTEYLQQILEHINETLPDLVLQQNLEYFEKEQLVILNTLILKEREAIIFTHLTKPLQHGHSIDQFFEWSSSVENDFRDGCLVSPYYDIKNEHYFMTRIEEIINKHPYKTTILKDYVEDIFQSKMSTNQYTLGIIDAICKKETDTYSFVESAQEKVPTKISNEVKQEIRNPPANIDAIIQSQWRICVTALNAMRQTRISESKWVQKAKAKGNHICPSCQNQHNIDFGIQHKNCDNPNAALTILYYWIKHEIKYAICSGCNIIIKLTEAVCWSCSAKMGSNAELIPPTW